MKVPTYHKFGLTKAQIDRSEAKDRKISDILTHYLTIGIGFSLGILVYIIYYKEVQPSTFIQIVMQVFLFGSVGVLCVGIPAVLFKLAEMFYFKQIKEKTEEHKTITQYKEKREDFDFWKIRKDYSFWKTMDGLSFEKEVMNLYLHLGYDDKAELCDENYPDDRVLACEENLVYFIFYTRITEFAETDGLDKMLTRMKENKCSELYVFSKHGFHKKINEYAAGKPVKLFDINGIIKVVRTVKI